MAQYLRVVRKGKHNVRVELPDHTTTLVPVDQLPLWELVQIMANSTEESISVQSPVETPTQEESSVQTKSYLKIVRKGKNNVRVELPDHTTTLVSVTDLPNWSVVDDTGSVKDTENAENMDEEIAEVFNDPSPTTQSESQTVTISDLKEVEDSPAESTQELVLTPDPTPEVEEESKSKRGRKPKVSSGEAPSRSTTFHRNTNGLGTEHPYETVDMNYDTVEYAEGVEAPF